MESLHVDDLASEGEKIRQRMRSPSKEQYRNNPDFLATLDTIDVLLDRVESVRTRLDSLWTARYQKLEANLKQRKFEKEAHQVSKHDSLIINHQSFTKQTSWGLELLREGVVMVGRRGPPWLEGVVMVTRHGHGWNVVQ